MKKLLIVLIAFIAVASTRAVLAQQKTTPENALTNYLNNNDKTYAWEILDSYPVGNTTAYSILMISQKWQGILWKHELIVLVPDTIAHNNALLFITGGSVKGNYPNIADEESSLTGMIAQMADKNKAVTAVLRQTPNQPLYDNLYEDALISHTLNNFRKDNDFEWPLLFPMTKSAIKAMDVIQDFIDEKLNKQIKDFLISGASKRGWTTWLAAASGDSRIKAIAPMVIDMLNMPVTLEYQKEIYGSYSEEIEDYVKLEIPQAINSEFGSSVVKMIDPFSYREKLSLPKMIFMGTNDPYWTVDAVKHYIYDIPGHNLLHYVPNAGHDLGDKKQAFASLNAFFSMNLTNEEIPAYNWELISKRRTINLHITTNGNKLTGAKLWTANSDTGDFRKSQWNYSNINIKSKKNPQTVKPIIKYPAKGYRAFYVDLIFSDSQNNEYSVSSRVFVADKLKVYEH